jgi:2-polyprenyl-3-methyl-5-hydroxy-6-metoxy-1,4-benzoquinol methylase
VSRTHQGRTHHGHDHHEDGPTEVVTSEAFWDQRYQSSSNLWSGHVNTHLVTEVSDLSPGVALDVGCGEGADAIWLAEQGWQVTAVDVSSVALERGAVHALEVGADVAKHITWLRADLTEWIPAAASYDLVSVQFLHLPKEQREVLHRRLAASVAPVASCSSSVITPQTSRQPSRGQTYPSCSSRPPTWRPRSTLSSG